MAVVMGKTDLKFPTNSITISKADFHKDSLSFMKTFFTGSSQEQQTEIFNRCLKKKKKKTYQGAGVRKKWKVEGQKYCQDTK